MAGIGATAYGRAKQRHNTLANLNLANPVLAAAEIVAAVDGTDLVVRMGDGATHWADLENIFPHPESGGGGGGTISQLEAWAESPLPLNSVGAGERGVSDSDIVWEIFDDPGYGGGPGGFLTVGTSGKLELDEGWYTISTWMGLTFAPGAGVDYVRVAWNIGGSLSGNSETHLPKSTNSAGQEVFMMLQSFGGIYSDGTDYVRPSFRWDVGGPDPVGSVLGVVAVKIG